MPYLALPAFADGMFLSARAINELNLYLADIRGRGQTVACPQRAHWLEGNAWQVGGRVWHVHDADHPDNEYLYYDIETHAGWSMETLDETGSADLYYGTPYPGTPILSLDPAAARYRGVVAIGAWPAGAHYSGANPVTVQVRRRAGWQVSVVECREILLPTGYTAMADATALLNTSLPATVAADLQAIVDNARVLDAYTWVPNPAFRCFAMGDADYATPAYIGAPINLYWRTNMGGLLTYYLGLWKESGTEGPTQPVSLQIDVNGTTVATLSTTADRSRRAPQAFEGEIDISGVARTQGALATLTLTLSYSRSGSNPGYAGAHIWFFGEVA